MASLLSNPLLWPFQSRAQNCLGTRLAHNNPAQQQCLDLYRSTDYEPLPRYLHISGRVGSKVVVQGGWTKDFSEESRQHLSSVVEIFDPYSESWEQRQVEGNAPPPGTCGAASASLHDDLFSFGGEDERKNFFNTVHRLDTKMWCWSQVSPQNADGAPMPKSGCGMVAFRNSLVVFGGGGVPQGPTEPQSFIKNTRFTNDSGWTNEFHIYNLSEGNKKIFHIIVTLMFLDSLFYLQCRCVELSCHHWRETSSMFSLHLHSSR